MAVKLLVAGVDKDERAFIESSVKKALASVGADEPWTVSLVRIGRQWSVTLEGPRDRTRSLSFVAPADRLGETIKNALGTAAEGQEPPVSGLAEAARSVSPSQPGPQQAASVPSRGGHMEDRHACSMCGEAFVVIYEMQPGESKILSAVACPHCWKLNRVEVGNWAAGGRDYRAEKA